MTEPQFDWSDLILRDTRAIASCSRWSASMFGAPPFTGMVTPGDIYSTQRQEILIAHVMGLARVLVDKEVFTQEEYGSAIAEWLQGRKVWAQNLANEGISAWNADNPGPEQPLLDVENLGSRMAEPATPYSFWPWQYDQVDPGPPSEDPPTEG